MTSIGAGVDRFIRKQGVEGTFEADGEKYRITITGESERFMQLAQLFGMVDGVMSVDKEFIENGNIIHSTLGNTNKNK